MLTLMLIINLLIATVLGGFMADTGTRAPFALAAVALAGADLMALLIAGVL